MAYHLYFSFMFCPLQFFLTFSSSFHLRLFRKSFSVLCLLHGFCERETPFRPSITTVSSPPYTLPSKMALRVFFHPNLSLPFPFPLNAPLRFPAAQCFFLSVKRNFPSWMLFTVIPLPAPQAPLTVITPP